jgi:hypothetical protein
VLSLIGLCPLLRTGQDTNALGMTLRVISVSMSCVSLTNSRVVWLGSIGAIVIRLPSLNSNRLVCTAVNCHPASTAIRAVCTFDDTCIIHPPYPAVSLASLAPICRCMPIDFTITDAFVVIERTTATLDTFRQNFHVASIPFLHTPEQSWCRAMVGASRALSDARDRMPKSPCYLGE